MTFTESGEVVGMEKMHTKGQKSTGEVLQECLWQAIDHQRITSGVFECAKLLHCNPENVMICVLPEAESENISIHIQHTLIEAFCWENDIRILKVKNATNLCKSLYTLQDDAQKRIIPDDLSCILVEYPKGRMSVEDQTLIDFYDEMISNDIYPKPVIELPV